MWRDTGSILEQQCGGKVQYRGILGRQVGFLGGSLGRTQVYMLLLGVWAVLLVTVGARHGPWHTPPPQLHPAGGCTETSTRSACRP